MSRPAVILINSMGTGGAERAVAMIAEGLRGRGREVRILCLERTTAGDETPTNLPIEYLSKMTVSSSAAVKLFFLPMLAWRLAAYLRREQAAIVVSHLFRANFVNILSRTLGRSAHRTILVNHTRVGRLLMEGMQGRISLTLCRMLYPKADIVASVSAGARAECARLLAVPAERAITLYDPVAAPPQKAAKAEPVHAVVAVGRMVGLKRFCDIIDAFDLIAPAYPGLELRLVGDGPSKALLEQRARERVSGPRIQFLGRLADPAQAVAGCEAFVSASETEGFGMAIVEALAAGVPVIASDCAFGPREILAPAADPERLLGRGADSELVTYGILFPVGSVEALAGSLRRMLGDAALRAELGRKGVLRAADFSMDRSLDAYEKLLFMKAERMEIDSLMVISANTSWYIYNFRLPLIRALLSRGWRVTVLAPPDEYTERLKAAGAGFHAMPLSAKGMNPLRELGTLNAFRKAYRNLRPAIALQYTIKPNIYGSIAARSLGIPVINNVSGLGSMFSGGLREMLARFLYRFAFSRAQLVLFQNPDDRKLFRDARLVEPRHTGLLPGSGVDTDFFAPRPRPEGPFTFLLAARLLKDKGVEDFISAARIVKNGAPEPRFVLLGRHEAADPQCVDAALLEEAVQDGLVEIPGHTDDVRRYIAEADCVVLPSYYREGVPRSLLEAASMGKPLIAADSVGTREPVQDGVNGFLCRPRDPADLAEKMKSIMEAGPEQRASMGAASRCLMQERFDERVVIETYLRAVDRIAGHPGSGA